MPSSACLQADARRAAARAKGPGGQQGNDSVASAAGSHPRHRLFGQATPGPGHHTTTAASKPAPGPARARGRAGHPPIAVTMPPAQPRVQVERPQRSEDERPGGAARRRPHSAARKARVEAHCESHSARRALHRPRRTPAEPLDTEAFVLSWTLLPRVELSGARRSGCSASCWPGIPSPSAWSRAAGRWPALNSRSPRWLGPRSRMTAHLRRSGTRPRSPARPSAAPRATAAE
jgi:hypothetical protein